jgi:hypothetical protein
LRALAKQSSGEEAEDSSLSGLVYE